MEVVKRTPAEIISIGRRSMAGSASLAFTPLCKIGTTGQGIRLAGLSTRSILDQVFVMVDHFGPPSLATSKRLARLKVLKGLVIGEDCKRC